MKAIPVFNPSPLGKAFCSPKRAAEYIRKGRAVLRPDGALQFTLASQAGILARAEEDRAFEESFREHRGEIVYWNGVYPDASFPPGCNVLFRKPGARFGV